MKFVDEASIYVKAGDGGRGCVSFRRAKFVPKGGPDGGDGGKGGDVIVVGKGNLGSLQDFRYKRIYRADNGKKGSGNNRTGGNGTDIHISVPLGTIVYNEDDGTVLADVTSADKTFIIARGGRGGRGNSRFATSTHRTPMEYDPGEPGEERKLHLVLKLLADVGIVGLPNVGKSTLISRLTSAHPRIGDYPFTTLTPSLGVLHGTHGTFVIADIPGIVEGASTGKGLGITFLKHVERTGMLLWVLDVSSGSPAGDFETLERELLSYNKDLLLRERILVLNKTDKVSPEMVREWTAFFQERGEQVATVSALTGEGLGELDSILRNRVDTRARDE